MSNKFDEDKIYNDLLLKMEADYKNSEVIQCFVKMEVTRAINGNVLSYQEIKSIAANFKQEISKKK